MAFYFIFWDGVGYGKRDPSINPFFASSLPVFSKLLGGTLPSLAHRHFQSATVSMRPVNTTMRIPGLPQSGTGQTAMMTGINAPKFVGKHFGPHPYSTLIPVIREKNLFLQLKSIGKSFFFANGYPRKYFDHIFGPKGRVPTVALSYLSAGRTLNTHLEILKRKAISADIAGTRWKELGHPEIDPVSPFAAGKLFHSFGRKSDFVMFEYFVTDHAGHAQDMPMAAEMLERMDGFISGLLHEADLTHDTICLVSDHGNIEDLSTKSHTKNPVPLIVVGNHHSLFSSRISNLTHVTPAIIEYFTSS